MRFYSLKVQNLVLKFDLVNRPRVVYSRAYGRCTRFFKGEDFSIRNGNGDQKRPQFS